MLRLLFVFVVFGIAYSAKVPVKRSVLSCDMNEILVECAHCGPKRCSDLGYKSPCSSVSSGCKEQCVCADGFVRNDTETCVEKKECPSCGGDPNAVSGCGNHCGNSCSDYVENNKTCFTGCRYNACDCREGFVFDDDVSKCVLPETCTKPPRCPRNETFTKCKPVCPPETCESVYSSYSCPANPTCKAGCKCKDGYLRLNGKCINSDDCPPPTPSCGSNEHYATNTIDCETSCADKDVVYVKACERSEPFTGCVCDNGFYRNEQGDCVKYEQCDPPTPSCGKNEHYATNTIYCETTCAMKDVRYIKACERSEPFTGCVCDDGFYRNEKGNCVTYKQCGPTLNCDGKINEEPSECASGCAKTCKTRIRNNVFCPAVCLKACVCVKGTLRHDNGTCVPVDQCSPPACNDDEVYKTCGGCETNCDNVGDTCRVCTADCREGCYCKKGLIRGPDGITCVEPEKCPKKLCADNEVWNKCPSNCFTGKCQDIWSKYDCSKAPDCCTPKCVCRSGYYWDSKGVCITGEQCTHRSSNGE